MALEVTDIWADFLQFSFAGGGERRGGPRVKINDREVGVQPVGALTGKQWRVEFDFAREFVASIEIESGDFSINAVEDETLRLLFGHDLRSTTEKVQRRGALQLGKGFQLVASYQSLLWARQRTESELSSAERIRVEASSACSIIYRYVQTPKEVNTALLEDLKSLAGRVVCQIDIKTPDARWYPSVQLAIGQLFLVSGRVSEALDYFLDISDKQEQVLRSEPICAFNISLANCLATYLLTRLGDSRREEYKGRWQYVFRFYPAHMDVRFGTMCEFGNIYDAMFANYRISFATKGVNDARFRPVTFEEVMTICMRVNLKTPRIRSIEAQLFPGQDLTLPTSLKRKKRKNGKTRKGTRRPAVLLRIVRYVRRLWS